MSARAQAPPCVWVVATEGTARRWAESLDPARGRAHVLAWGRVRPLASPADLEAARRAAAPDLLLLSSAEALAFLGGERLEGLSAACVGGTTAGEARAHGLEVACVGEGGGAELAQAVLGLAPRPRTLLWLRGEDAHPELAATLRAAGGTVHELVTYRVEADAGLGAALRAAPAPAAVLVGSPRAAEALAAALAWARRVLPHGVALVAAGPSTAQRLGALGLVCSGGSSLEGWLVGRGAARYHPRSR